METIIIKAKTKRKAEEVRRKLRTITGLQIETWKELDRALPNVIIPEEEIMAEVRAVRYGAAK